MKLKLSIFTLLFLSSLTPLPAQAGIWDFIRNSTAVSYVFGKPTEVNYTTQTRLPIIEAQPSFWSLITNFFAWRNFKATNQPQAEQPASPISVPAHQPTQQTASSQAILPTLSPEVAQNLVNRLNALRQEHEAKKLTELAAQERTAQLREIHDNELNSNREQIAQAQKEKESLISLIEQEHKESAQHFYNKNIAQEELRKLQLAVEEADKRDQAKFGELLQKILRLKNELKETRDAKESSLEALHTTKRAITHIETDLKALTLERNSLDQALAESRAQKDSLAFQLKGLESKFSNDLHRNKNDLDTEKKSHDQTKKDLESSKQQASVARSSSIELNKQLIKKNEEIQHIQQVYNAEIAEIQQLLRKKRSEIDLLLAKLERDEKEKSHVLQTITSAIASFETEQNKKISHFKNAVTRKLQDTEHRIIAIQAKLPRVSKIVPQLPVILEKSEENITDFERQRTARASLNYSAIEINQSNLATNPALHTSSISKEVDSFSELPLSASSSPELPVELIDAPEIDNKLQIDPLFYTDQVTKGRKYADAIYENRLDDVPTKTQQEYLQSIIALNWHLYDLAVQKGQGFVEGTFVLEDTEFKLYNFLMAYTQRVNPEVKGTHADPLLHVSHNPFAYSRDASHYKHLKAHYRPYGIDVRFGADKKAEALLPAYKRHILFGKIDEETNLFYLKIENFGIHTSDVYDHSKEFASAQLSKNNIWAGSVRKIAGWLGYTIPTDSGDGNQKERIVPAFLEDFDAVINASETLTKDQKLMHMGYARIEGFKTLYYTPLVARVPGIKKLAQKYENHPKKYDNMRWRTGEEVIHRQDQWVPRLTLRNATPNK